MSSSNAVAGGPVNLPIIQGSESRPRLWGKRTAMCESSLRSASSFSKLMAATLPQCGVWVPPADTDHRCACYIT
eukprot:2641618-Pleurochrysis_carterae.AAC.2